jgi:RNA polymerase sigma factor (sigma-70 family)
MDKYSLTYTAMGYPADLFLKCKLYGQEKKSVENLRLSDKNLIQFIYDEYANDLLSYGLKMGYQKEVLEDAIHDVFYKLCLSPKMLKNVSELKFYLFRALKNQLLNINKSTSKFVITDIPEFKLSVKADSLHLLIEAEEQVRIKEKINKLLQVLSDKQREIIYLRFIHEMSYDEIGELLAMTSASVRNVVYKAISKIRK